MVPPPSLSPVPFFLDQYATHCALWMHALHPLECAVSAVSADTVASLLNTITGALGVCAVMPLNMRSSCCKNMNESILPEISQGREKQEMACMTKLSGEHYRTPCNVCQ